MDTLFCYHVYSQLVAKAVLVRFPNFSHGMRTCRRHLLVIPKTS
jgi:hypothetical protein